MSTIAGLSGIRRQLRVSPLPAVGRDDSRFVQIGRGDVHVEAKSELLHSKHVWSPIRVCLIRKF
jgi:hypothetical protein